MSFHLRIARPVSDVARSVGMYCHGLDLIVVGSFEDHDGFDGVMLAPAGASYHFEFTASRAHPIAPAPTEEDLVVFYIRSRAEWEAACSKMLAADFLPTTSFNPYWDVRGRTFEDHDGTLRSCKTRHGRVAKRPVSRWLNDEVRGSVGSL
jgi:hypothetical protein